MNARDTHKRLYALGLSTVEADRACFSAYLSGEFTFNHVTITHDSFGYEVWS